MEFLSILESLEEIKNKINQMNFISETGEGTTVFLKDSASGYSGTGSTLAKFIAPVTGIYKFTATTTNFETFFYLAMDVPPSVYYNTSENWVKGKNIGSSYVSGNFDYTKYSSLLGSTSSAGTYYFSCKRGDLVMIGAASGNKYRDLSLKNISITCQTK